MVTRSTAAIIAILAFLLLPTAAPADWDFSRHAIPLEAITGGGPSRDGIPALTSPKYLPASRAGFLREEEQVLGVFINGVARAYPTRILSWHELVNDRFGGLPVLVSW